jgi:hypothetical protein
MLIARQNRIGGGMSIGHAIHSTRFPTARKLLGFFWILIELEISARSQCKIRICNAKTEREK